MGRVPLGSTHQPNCLFITVGGSQKLHFAGNQSFQWHLLIYCCLIVDVRILLIIYEAGVCEALYR